MMNKFRIFAAVIVIGLLAATQSATAQIVVKLVTGDRPHIVAHGCEFHVITDDEIGKFQLRDRGRIQDRIEKDWGRRPHEIYFKDSPKMPWKSEDASYARFGWHPLRTQLCAVRARLLDISTQTVTIASQTFENNNDTPATFTAEVHREVTNRVNRSWNAQVTAGFSQSISYEIGGDAVGGKVGGETTFSFEASYGEGGEKERSETVGTQTGVEVSLDPGKKASAQLVVAKGVIRAQVDYEVRVDGQVFIDFGKKKFKGHHFYADALNKAWGGTVGERRSEQLSIEHYSNAHVIVAKQ